MKEFIALFKFGKLEHLTALQEEGHLHCKTLQYFSELEDQIKRGDELEGVTDIINLDGGSFKLKDVNAPDSTYSKAFTIDTGKLLQKAKKISGNIFCLYGISLERDHLKNEHIISEEIKAFGDHYLIIKDCKEFLKRVEKKLTQEKLTGTYGFITYKDFSTFTGKKSHFEKDILFQNQNEFRIFINNREDACLDIKIGSIADISEIGSSKNLETIDFYAVD